ncbi:chorismate mutase [Haloimpatiens sp. FM7315]|uniref:chorismate mutase n=1 Tax=Haloimpatiens sp. FM7315 TaxID=3298609 RepID=UPI00370BE77B
MNKERLKNLRNEIDDIDEKLVELFEKRMKAVLCVAEYKKENNIPVFNEEREKEVIKKNLNRLKNKNLKVYAEEFFKNTMAVSRKYQSYKIFQDNIENFKENNKKNFEVKPLTFDKMIKVGFQGVKGSFSEDALTSYFGEKVDSISFETFDEVFLNLNNKVLDYAILPLENSSTGAISEVYDLLRKYELYVIGEKCIKIEQNLLALKDADIKNIKEIYSHPQGFKQSSHFLKDYNKVKLIPYYNTAISAKYIKNQNDITKAAIGSRRASEIYKLQILKKNINNKKNNHTRFIIVARELDNSEDNNKISVLFSLEHKAGTLFNVLRYFADNDINLLKIESRPTGDENWTYFFYIDFEGNIKDKSILNALDLIKYNSKYFKIVGQYINDKNCR